MSNLGAVVLGGSVSGVFGSVCAVPCELSKRSKCVETIPNVETFPYVMYCIVETDSNFYA